ncbi:MAG: DEAD/DEAH box helicase [Bacteroidota bacterium]
MAYALQIDLTSAAKKKERDETPIQTPFEDAPDDAPTATVDSLPKTLRAGVDALGWESLMPVQSQAIPHTLDGRDVVVQSRTGSGKTGAFLLPMLELLDPDAGVTQALVLCPTRELAKQIHGEFEKMNSAAPEAERVRAVPVYGGTAYGPQIDAFKEGVEVVIGTPGRVLDHLERRSLRLDGLKMLVLDEADEMLSMGFYPDMRKLKRFLPRERVSAMFSATMPYQVQRVGKEFLTDPIFLAPAGGRIHVDMMTHYAVEVPPMEKDRALATLIEWENPSSAIVFANTKRQVEYLATFLQNFGYDADGISSDLTQKAREKVMGRLRAGKLRILVATDVAARGIDVSDLSHVFQFDIPQDKEYYVHRSGRTARAGKSGVSITLFAAHERTAIADLIKKYDIPIETRELPTEEDLGRRVGERLTNRLEDQIRGRSAMDKERAARFIPVVHQLVEEGEPELLAMLLDQAYRQSLHEVTPAPEVDDADEKPKGRKKRRRDDDDRDDAPEASGDDADDRGDGDEEKPKRKRSRSRRRSRRDDD